MDCEQFDQIVLDLLYGELTGLSSADAKRHVDGCDRCAEIFTRLRTVRRKSSLPLLSPPSGLDQRLLEAAKAAQREIPWHRKLGRAVSWAGSYAMRPQVAMAALLLLMLGSSLLLLRGRAGSERIGTVRITEHGVPEGDRGQVQQDQRILGPSAVEEKQAARSEDAGDDASIAERAQGSARVTDTPPPTAAEAPAQPSPAQETIATARDGYADALALYESRDYANALRAFDMIASKGGSNASNAALYAARAVRATSGCPTATARLESVVSRYGGTSSSEQAKWELAACYKVLGNYDRARQLYAELSQGAGNKERAEREIARLTPTNASPHARKASDSSATDRAKNSAAKAAPARPTSGPTATGH